MRVNAAAAAAAARALSRSLACSDALTFSTHSHRFHLQSVTHLNRRKRHESADDDPRTMWSPAAVAGRLSSSTWLVVVLLCAITLRVVAAGATITSQMSPRVVQTQYAILPTQTVFRSVRPTSQGSRSRSRPSTGVSAAFSSPSPTRRRAGSRVGVRVRISVLARVWVGVRIRGPDVERAAGPPRRSLPGAPVRVPPRRPTALHAAHGADGEVGRRTST